MLDVKYRNMNVRHTLHDSIHKIKMYIMFTLININEISTFFKEIAAAKVL
jgi:hypothetical protein